MPAKTKPDRDSGRDRSEFIRDALRLNLESELSDLDRETRDNLLDIFIRLGDLEKDSHWALEKEWMRERETDRIKIARLEERVAMRQEMSAPRKISPGELVAYFALALTVLGTIGNALLSFIRG